MCGDEHTCDGVHGHHLSDEVVGRRLCVVDDGDVVDGRQFVVSDGDCHRMRGRSPQLLAIKNGTKAEAIHVLANRGRRHPRARRICEDREDMSVECLRQGLPGLTPREDGHTLVGETDEHAFAEVNDGLNSGAERDFDFVFLDS